MKIKSLSPYEKNVAGYLCQSYETSDNNIDWGEIFFYKYLAEPWQTQWNQICITFHQITDFFDGFRNVRICFTGPSLQLKHFRSTTSRIHLHFIRIFLEE